MFLERVRSPARSLLLGEGAGCVCVVCVCVVSVCAVCVCALLVRGQPQSAGDAAGAALAALPAAVRVFEIKRVLTHDLNCFGFSSCDLRAGLGAAAG